VIQKEFMVYVIDDDASVRRAFQLLLQSAEFRVETFSSANEFLENEGTSDRAVIILNMKMPGLTGLDLLKQLEPRISGMQIIAISALDDVPTKELARELGAVAFFQKPVDGQALIDSIGWAMRGKGH
jgi:FixJ family two-component response regulator